MAYKDVFTGMVFYRPVSEFKLVVNIPGLFDDAFTEEYKRRVEICGYGWNEKQLAAYVERYKRVAEYG